MNLNETINNILPSELKAKLKSAFMQFAEVAPIAEEPKQEEVKMQAEVKLLDGNVISVEGEFKVGEKVFLVTPEGLVAAPNGEHEAEDGNIYEVMDGVIIEIAKKVTEEPEEQMPVNQEMETLKAEMSKLKAEFSKQTETLSLALSALNKIIETPVTEPIEKKVEFESLTPFQKHKLAKYGKV